MKSKISYFFLLYVLAIINIGCNPVRNIDSDRPYLIVLSLDGFRWDYPDVAHTPTLDSLAKVGCKAESLKPCFPTKTFPNHYSIATGLYPDNHGIVQNRFFANDLNKHYSIKDRSAITDGRFYGGQPIWNAAENNDIKTATLFWVGASAKINNQRASYWSTYNESLPFESRIDSIYNWLRLPENKRPHLIMWYYHEPDESGHHHGPESDGIIRQVEKLDTYLDQFFTKMRQLPNFDELNFIVMSDHGMAAISKDKEVYLNTILDSNDVEFYDGANPVINIKVKKDKINKVYNDLLAGSENIQVWKRGEVPGNLHYGNNIRTQDITVLAKPEWSIYYKDNMYDTKGAHGYSNDFKDMHAIFYAAGPAFKNNYLSPTFNNIDIYPLVGEVMKFKVPDCDGNRENIIGLLKN